MKREDLLPDILRQRAEHGAAKIYIGKNSSTTLPDSAPVRYTDDHEEGEYFYAPLGGFHTLYKHAQPIGSVFPGDTNIVWSDPQEAALDLAAAAVTKPVEDFSREDLFSRATVKPSQPQREPGEKAFDVQAWIEKQKSAKKEFFGNIESLCERLAGELQENNPATLNKLLNFFSSKASKWSMTNTIGLFLQKPDIQRPITIREADKKFGHKPKRGVRWASILVPCIPRSKPEESKPKEDETPGVRDTQVDGQEQPGKPAENSTETAPAVRRPVYFKAVQCVVDLGRETEGPAILESEGVNLPVANELIAAIKQYAESEGISVEKLGWTGQSVGGQATRTAAGENRIAAADCVSPEFQFVTYVHELAHHQLGHMGNKEIPKDTKEIQAELTGYVVAQSFGLPSDYSATYLKAFGADRQKIYDNLRVVGRITKQIINGIDRQLRLGVTVEAEPVAEAAAAHHEDIVDDAAVESEYRQDTITIWQKKNTDFTVAEAFQPSDYVKVAEITGSNLGHAFGATQSVEGRWQKNAEEGMTVLDQKARSTSVGDVLELEGAFYAVTRDGFDSISPADPNKKSVRV